MLMLFIPPPLMDWGMGFRREMVEPHPSKLDLPPISQALIGLEK